MKRVLWYMAAGCLLLSGCDKRPEHVIPEKEMVELLTDMQLAQAYFHTSASGQNGRADMTESILEKHDVSQEDLDSTIAYYGRNMDEYYLLYQKVEKNLRARSGRTEESVSEDDIWPYSRFAAFFPGQMAEGITFSMPADGLDPGAMLDWRLRVTSPEGVEMMMGVEYENGIASVARKSAAGNSSPHLSIITDTAFVVKRIFGTLSVPRSSLPLWADSIRLVKTEFDSLEYQKIRSQKRVYPPSPEPLPSPPSPEPQSNTWSGPS